MADTLRVLYVDDEPDLLDIGRIFLEQAAEFSVKTIDSAPAALTLLKNEKFDAIISDYQMPGMSGIQFLIEVRNKFGSIPFILFTGKGREEVVIQAINSGADFYLQKGGDPSAQFAELSHKIKKAVEGCRAEEALRESENTFATIFKSNPVSMTLVSATNGVFVDVNDAFMRNTGYIREEMVGKNSMELGIFADKDEQEWLASELQKKRRVAGMELHTRTKSGEIRTSLFSSSVIVIEGRPYILSTVEDISGRKFAEETLRRVNQKLNVISKLTREDLFSQIVVLNDCLLRAKEQAAGQEQVILTLQKSQQAARLIQGTIEYSNDYQNMGIKPQKWQNVRMVMLFGLSQISNGEIKPSLETGDLEIFADPLLELVCQGLFENSFQHGGHDIQIRVWHTVTPGGATIVFEDNGIGITQEKKEQIFLRSGDTDHASARNLNFAREILDITGITITETGEPGKGARFEMRVPNGAWRMAGKGD